MWNRSGNKYNAVRVETDGRSFASKGERDCYEMLKLMEKAGEIEILQCQDHVHLTSERILYIPDFKIMDKRLNEIIWIEFKGFETDIWKIKKKLWRGYGPGRLRIYKGQGLKIRLVEEIIPKFQEQLEFPG